MRISPPAPPVLIRYAAIIVGAVWLSWAAMAQTSAQPNAAVSHAPQTAHIPDLSGTWMISAGGVSWDPNDPAGNKPDGLPMTSWARKQFEAAKPPFGADATFDNPNDPVQKYCDPPGPTRQWNYPWQFTIQQTPGNVYILFEYFRAWRVVAMNRPHTKDPDLTWLGDSVGHYEGDALVIDTIGLNDKTWLDNVGHPHSDALHTIERLRRIDPNTLELAMTIDDPKAYTKSWTSKKTFQLSHFPLGETMCSISEMQSFQKNIMDRTVQQQPKK
jgi:hypothetical protein